MAMTRVFARLYLGSLREAESLAVQNHSDIRTVLTVCAEEVNQRASDISYLHFPLADCRSIPPGRLDAILTSIANHIRVSNVLVHCAAGFSRSPVIVAAYLDRVGYLSFEEALAYLAHLRPELDPSPVLISSVLASGDRPEKAPRPESAN